MKAKKLLSMLFMLTILFTSIGALGITANAETAITETINLAPGKAYTLPAEIEGVAVTGWTNAQGEAVNVADTSVTGYRYYTAELENGTTAKYRVNVGAYVPKYENLLELFDVDCITTSGYVNNSKGYIAVGLDDAARVQVVEKDGKKAVRFGPGGATNSSFIRTGSKSIGGEYKLDANIKIEGIDITGITNDLLVSQLYFRTYNPAKTISQVDVYVTEEGFVKLTAAGYSGETNESVLTNIIIDEDSNTPWMSLSYSVYDNNKWSLSVNGTNVFKDKARETENYSATETFRFSPIDKNGATVYCADVNVDVVHYFTGDLPVSVSDKVEQYGPAAQSATVTLTMSDGETKNFTVNYTADTSQAGIKMADGKIDGFDGTISVSYTVVCVTDEIINTYIGADVTLADGRTKADTSVFGRKYYNGIESEAGITNYTVNTGTWGLKVSDDLSAHESATYTKKDNVTQFETIKANSQNGFKLVVYNTDYDDASAVLAKDPDNSANWVFKMEETVNSENLRWYVGDTFDGSFKVKIKLRLKDYADVSSAYSLRVRVLNSEGKDLYLGYITNDKNGNISIADGYMDPDKGQRYYSKAMETATLTNGLYDTGWMELEIIENAQTKTIDTYLNGKLGHSGLAFNDTTATKPDIGRINISRRAAEAKNNADVYIDDVEVYSHRVFTGVLPEDTQVLLGQNAATLSSSIALTLSDSSLISCPMTLEGVNTAALGTVAATGVIDGFDDKLNVNVKVCNYSISSIGWANGTEYVSAPVDGGSIEDATFKNVGDTTQAQAIFAWYNSSDKLKNAKIVDISGISKGETKKVSVGLALPEEVDGSYLKVFVLNSTNALVPLDLTHLEENVVATVPKVFLIGDSTTCNYEDNRFPEKGLGQQIDLFLNDEVQVINLASSGKTTTTIQTSGLWDSLINQAGAGDYIFISFGHNDQGVVTKADFTANLEKFISDAKSKGANVIMYTPIARRTQGIEGKAYTEFNCQNWSGYKEKYIGNMDSMQEVCQQYNIPFIDMTTISSTYLQSIKQSGGDEATIKLYMCDIYYSWDSIYRDLRSWSESDHFYNETYREGQYGMKDNTHFTQYGAAIWAQLLLNNIKAAYPNINLVNYMENLDKQVNYPYGTIAQ